MKKRSDSRPGPDPDRLVIEVDWQQAVGKALARKRPSSGWPPPEPKPKKPKPVKVKKKRGRKPKVKPT